MLGVPALRKETRYGAPAADQILYNRYYVIGYSYYIRQAKWALEIVDPGTINVERLDNFRSDFRIPPMFRADANVYKHSGFDRGHLVASANQDENDLQNSETFLLSNMSPQHPSFNRQIWRQLEIAVRMLNARDDIFETYVISGPVFNFDEPIQTLTAPDGEGVTLPIPHRYFKSILAEDKRGNLLMWSFMMENKVLDGTLEDYLVPTVKVERYAGILLWEQLRGEEILEEKSKIRRFWLD